MTVFSQINNCQLKQNKQQNKKTKQKKQKTKTDKTKRGAPLLGLAKSIYYLFVLSSCSSNKIWSHSPLLTLSLKAAGEKLSDQHLFI